MDKSSPPGDAFRATVMDYLKAELAAADPAERDDILNKAESLLQFDLAKLEAESKLAARDVEAELQ
jgi:hypothetical protein